MMIEPFRGPDNDLLLGHPKPNGFLGTILEDGIMMHYGVLVFYPISIVLLILGSIRRLRFLSSLFWIECSQLTSLTTSLLGAVKPFLAQYEAAFTSKPERGL